MNARPKTNEHQVKGMCQVCKKVNHTSIWAVSLQVNWFRGDDEYVGKICKICKKGSGLREFVEAYIEKQKLNNKQP